MAQNRISASQRIQLQNVAEREVMRFKDDHKSWHKHVHNVDLDPVQVFKCWEMDRHPNTLDFSCRRTGKTAVKEMYLLKFLACQADQELGIVAPREAQSKTNLTYHTDAIRRSEILTAWLNYKDGRKQMADLYYQFANRSLARAYGIMAQVDGGDLTAASLEEVDDMPPDRLYGRFLLMMGATRRLGASDSAKNDPQIRITGVYKGADTLTAMLKSGSYYVLAAKEGAPAVAELKYFIEHGWLAEDEVENLDDYDFPIPLNNVVRAIEMGLINAQFVENIRPQLSRDEFIRQLLCVNLSAKNFIWEVKVREALQKGLAADMQMAEPLPGESYKKRGLIAFGYDHLGHGENPTASCSALVVTEQIAGFTAVIFCYKWGPGTDEPVIIRDLLRFWAYFDPDAAFGDSYGVGMLRNMNDMLFQEGLTDIDPAVVLAGGSTKSTWGGLAFAPLQFEGQVKHSMATSLRSLFHNAQMVLPYVDEGDESLDTEFYRLLLKQVPNITAEAVTGRGYATYKMKEEKWGDDLFDALMASVWGLVSRGAVAVETSITVRVVPKAALPGQQFYLPRP